MRKKPEQDTTASNSRYDLWSLDDSERNRFQTALQDGFRTASNSRYDLWSLDDSERNRFQTALQDGFRTNDGKQYSEHSLPQGIDPGVLNHKLLIPQSYIPKLSDEYEPFEDLSEEFWHSSDGDEPPDAFDCVPVNFNFQSMQEYFQNQRNRAFEYYRNKYGIEFCDDIIEDHILISIYSKVWYELRINKIMDDLYLTYKYLCEESNSLIIYSLLKESVVLGRMIEQYYWKFFHETDTKRGKKSASAAKRGGHERATHFRARNQNFQLLASEIWNKNPSLSKTRVAELIKSKLSLSITPRQIVRIIKRA